jgi:hypothetical protein
MKLDRNIGKYALIGALITSVSAFADEDRSWHLLTQSRGGTVSLLRDLTKNECDYARARMLGLPATEAEQEAENRRDEKLYGAECPPDNATKAQWKDWQGAHPLAQGCRTDHGGMSWGGWTTVGDRDISSAECFQ